MISAKKMMYIELFCHSFVSHEFAFMLNPKYRGVNFKWSDFASRMEHNVPTHFYSAKYWKKDLTKEELEYLQSITNRIAKNLLKDSGLVEKELDKQTKPI